jgi:hypothetical protein
MTQRTPRFPGIKRHTPDGRPLVSIGGYDSLQPGPYAFEYVGFRPPLKGEYYLSGAVVQAWRAPNDLPTAYHVVKLGEKYVARPAYQRA